MHHFAVVGKGLRATCVVAVCAAALTGCAAGSSSAGTKAPGSSTGGAGGSEAGAGAPVAQGSTTQPVTPRAGAPAADDQLAKYARCLRDQKIKVFVDGDSVAPVENQKPALVDAALKACAQFSQAVPLTPDLKEHAFQTDLKWARCLRKQGIDVKDPKRNSNEPYLPLPTTPQLKAAYKACNMPNFEIQTTKP